MMPPGAADARERQITALAGIVHEKRTSTTLGGMLADLRGRKDLATELDAFEAYVMRDAPRCCKSFDRHLHHL